MWMPLWLRLICAAFAIALCVWLIERRRDQQERVTWTYIRHQGGGTVTSPQPMTELEALEFCRSLGSVMYVDRARGFIFYRPKE